MGEQFNNSAIRKEPLFSIVKDDAEGLIYQLQPAEKFHALTKLYQQKAEVALNDNQMKQQELKQGITRLFRAPSIRQTEKAIQENVARIEDMKNTLEHPPAAIDYVFPPRSEGLYDTDSLIRMASHQLEEKFAETEQSIRNDDLTRGGQSLRNLELNLLNGRAINAHHYDKAAEIMRESSEIAVDQADLSPEKREANMHYCDAIATAYAKEKIQKNPIMFSDLGKGHGPSVRENLEKQLQEANPELKDLSAFLREAKWIGLNRLEKEQKQFKSFVGEVESLADFKPILQDRPVEIDYSYEKNLLNPYSVGVAIVRNEAPEMAAKRGPKMTHDMELGR